MMSELVSATLYIIYYSIFIPVIGKYMMVLFPENSASVIMFSAPPGTRLSSSFYFEFINHERLPLSTGIFLIFKCSAMKYKMFTWCT